MHGIMKQAFVGALHVRNIAQQTDAAQRSAV